MVIIAILFFYRCSFCWGPSCLLLLDEKVVNKAMAAEYRQNYRPTAAILVPVHNEEKTIRLKLESLRRVEYRARFALMQRLSEMPCPHSWKTRRYSTMMMPEAG